MAAFILTDVVRDLWVDHWSLCPADLGLSSASRWSIAKRTLRGGRRDGVELIHLDNGVLALSILPTRGMNLWKGHFHSDALGWHSPVTDGPIHPALVNLSLAGGLGWLDGFDELLARCGLENNGAPYVETTTLPDGSHRHVQHTLHGKIANIPAHFVAVTVDDRPPHTITIEGHVDEARLFGPRVRMVTKLTTTPGANRIVVRDEFTNLGDQPTGMQILYHWNFGPPFLEAGGQMHAPAKAVVPRDPRAVEGLDHFDTYDPPLPGYAEQVYFYDLAGAGPDGRTLALLRNRDGDKGVVLRFAKAQLPCFSLWKNTGGLKDGFVTGLEPATNYPNPRPFEAQRGRVVTLAPGVPYVAETTLEVLDTTAAVAAIEAEIRELQGSTPPVVHPRPVEPFA